MCQDKKNSYNLSQTQQVNLEQQDVHSEEKKSGFLKHVK